MAPKKKQEKMALGDFLSNQSLGSWADEMDAQPMPAVAPTYQVNRNREDRGDREFGEKRSFTQPSWENARSGGGMGMGGGMGDRGASYGRSDRPQYAVREQLPLPTRPPYTAHLGNLAYDVKQADVEDFLAECKVTSVRIVEDKFDHKPKGFGYVEFETLDGLKAALTKTETPFMGRNIKISVAEPPKDRPESSRDLTDWSRKGPLPDLPMSQRQPSNRGFRGGFDNMSDAGSERGGGRRPGFFEGENKTRDLGNWERKGPLSPAPTAGPPVRDGGRLREGQGSEERRRSPAWGEGRSEAGSRPPRREFEAARPAAERQPTAAEQDNQWRARMRPDASPAATPEASAPTSPQAQAPKERPRLNLAKRTVSTAEPDSAAGSATDSKASPFGAARPIDTATREREVEEKRELALRQKAEADEKAKADKAAQDAAARAARAERADRGQAQEEDKAPNNPVGTPRAPRNDRRSSRQQNGPRSNAQTTNSQTKENGEAPRPSFSILQHEGDDAATQEERAGELDAPDASANGTIVGDKETKPQEIVQEVGAGAGAAQGTTAETMEDDGWSTVPAKGKQGRRGGQRAVAS